MQRNFDARMIVFDRVHSVSRRALTDLVQPSGYVSLAQMGYRTRVQPRGWFKQNVYHPPGGTALERPVSSAGRRETLLAIAVRCLSIKD